MARVLHWLLAAAVCVSCGGDDETAGTGDVGAGGEGGGDVGAAGDSSAGDSGGGGESGSEAAAGEGGTDAAAGEGGANPGAGGATGGNGGTGLGGTGGALAGSGGGGGAGNGVGELCTSLCDKVEANDECAFLPYACEPYCLAYATGWCAEEAQAYFECQAEQPEACLLQADQNCAPQWNTLAQCSPGPLDQCIEYCAEAATADGCVSSVSCFENCGESMRANRRCAWQQIQVYECATGDGTPTCDGITPGASCGSVIDALAQCQGMGGTGGMGGAGGTGGSAGSGGMGGAGGNSGRSCFELEQDYASALDQAKYCAGGPIACGATADKQLGCDCQTSVNPSTLAYDELEPIKLEWYQKNCDAGVVCGACPTPAGVACLSSRCTEVY